MSREFFCEKCSLQFGKKYVFDLHLSLVHGEKIEVKVESPICEENLQESQISETKFSYQPVQEKEKRFKCDVCYTTFAKKGHLKSHMTAVHEGKKPFQCNTCDARFTQKSSLKNHMESVHEEKKAFQCDICDYRCSLKGNLTKHVASVHEGNKPFKCSICDANFHKRAT
jgi:KRAB domain-containing zinc finger protein